MRSPQAAFKEVKASIQTMIDELTVEQEEEIKKKDFCVDAIQANEKETDDKTRVKQTAEATIEDLTMTIKKLTQEIAALKQAIKDLQVQYKRAAEDREKENSDFQRTVADQRATAKLLTGALDILKGFYEKNALMQASVHNGSTKPAGAPPPPGFKKMEKNSQSGGVMGMIQQIIDDAKAMEADAVKAEEDAQTAYETFVKDSNLSLDTMSKDIVNKTEDKGKAEVEKAQKEAELKTVVEELSELKSALADLHADCDFTLNNFDTRQTARGNEIQALREATSIFSGAR
jgi:chromosome segregation ATPase